MKKERGMLKQIYDALSQQQQLELTMRNLKNHPFSAIEGGSNQCDDYAYNFMDPEILFPFGNNIF